MKRLLSAFFFVFLFSLEAMTQSWMRMQSWGLDFESVTWINDQQGVMVGEKLIIRTSDGGTTWEEVLQKFDVRFFDVIFLDETVGIAVGENGSIYQTLDAGKSWAKKNSGTQNDLFSIAKNTSSQLTAVGEKGEIIISLDFGVTWKKVFSGTTLNLHDITFVNENTSFIAAEGGKILRSFDKGNSWTVTSLSQSNTLFGIAFSNEMIGYAVGENGLYIKTLDGGATWSALNSTNTNTLRKVAISPLDVRIVVAVGDVATVIRTANSGSTFAKPNLGATNFRNIKNLAFKPKTNLVSAGGQDGYLINSTNAGSSWAQKFAGIRNNFTTVDFKNVTTGFIGGENGSIYVTTNGATTLVSRPLPESLPVQSLDFWNTSFGYTGSEGGKIYRTSNSGTTWVPVFNPANRTISGFYLFAPSVVYLAGSQGYISRSFDSGVTWDQSIVSNTTENLKDISFFDFAVGIAIGEKGQISWSFGGNAWETLPKVTNENLNDLAKIDTTRAVIVGNGGIILKTDDKGRSWRKIESGTSKNLNSVDFFGEIFGYAAGEDGMALITTDAGNTWTQFSTGTIRNLASVSAGTDLKAYFVGEDGTILTFTCIPPVGSLGQIAGDSQSCISSTSYSIAGEPQAGSEIIWRVDGGEILSGQGTNKIEVKWTMTGRNAVLVSRSNFCGSGETSALEVNVSPVPSTNLAVTGEGTVCQENTYIYSLPNIEGITYTWSATGGEVKQGQGTHEVKIAWYQNGQQLLTVTQENRCGRIEPISKPISVNSAPQAPSGISGESKIGLGEQTYEIDEVAGLNYRWSVSAGGRILSGQGTGRVVIDWENEGDYELAVEAQNECNFSPKRILPVNVNIITALEPLDEGTLKIYPNPSQGHLTISSGSLDYWTEIIVFNPVGQLIRTESIAGGQQEVRLSSLPKGLLLIKLQGKNGVLSKKVLVR